MIPVAAKEPDCAIDSWSAGRAKSLRPAMTRPCNEREREKIVRAGHWHWTYSKDEEGARL